jgi:hypothetical protein
VTQSGYDFALVYTVPGGASIDASGAQLLRFAIRGTNTTPYRWQVASPVVVLEDATGSRAQYAPAANLLNWDGASWVGIALPLAGDPLWSVTGQAVDRSAITRIEIHTDTWDYGFTLDVDALSFDRAGASCAIGDVPGCGVGYAPYAGACVPISVACAVANGSGAELWGTSGYGACFATSCNAGYAISGTGCDFAWQRGNYGAYEISITGMTDRSACAQLCLATPACKVASFHDATALYGWANTCVLRSAAWSFDPTPVGIWSWVRP